MLILVAICCHAQTNVLYGQFLAINQGGRTNTVMTLAVIKPINRPLVSNDNIQTCTDTNGNFTFTNVLWGKFSLSANDSSQTTWILYVGANTLGLCPILSLITNSAAIPPNPGTNYFTQAQALALFMQGLTGRGSVTVTYSGNGIWNVNATGGGGGGTPLGSGTNTFVSNLGGSNQVNVPFGIFSAFTNATWGPNPATQAGNKSVGIHLYVSNNIPIYFSVTTNSN